jgi:hypothetical protein
MSMAAPGEHLNQSADVHISERQTLTIRKGKTKNVFIILLQKEKIPAGITGRIKSWPVFCIDMYNP